jgi:transcriptional regulator with XRE-family HTH domain
MNDIQGLLVINIKKNRKRLKWSQSRLAEECQLSQNFIGKIESKLTFPSNDTLDKIVRAFQIHPYELFLEDEDIMFIESINEYEKYANRIIEHIKDDIRRIKEENHF